MKNDTGYTCPMESMLRLVGGKYKVLILWHLINKTVRFNELCRLVPDATQKMLTQQLRDLEDDNLIIRTVYPVIPPKVEYCLSELDKSLIPVLNVMSDWSKNNLKV